MDVFINLGDIADTHKARVDYFNYVKGVYSGRQIVIPGNHDFRDIPKGCDPYEYWCKLVPKGVESVTGSTAKRIGNAVFYGLHYYAEDPKTIKRDPNLDYHYFNISKSDIVDMQRESLGAKYGFSHICPHITGNPGFNYNWKFVNHAYYRIAYSIGVTDWFYGHTHRRMTVKYAGLKMSNVSIGYDMRNGKPDDFIYELEGLEL